MHTCYFISVVVVIVLRECFFILQVRIAQEVNDEQCLTLALSWLCRLVSNEQTGTHLNQGTREVID
jgi:hypothetical protein